MYGNIVCSIFRYEPTDEVFFVQNAGAVAAGTGLNKSAIIQKISLSEANAVKDLVNATGQVTVTVVPSNPMVINPNGQHLPVSRANLITLVRTIVLMTTY